MKAISIRGEYWGEIEGGRKTEEYRSWSTSHRGDILICYTAQNGFPGGTSMVADLYDCVPLDDGGYAFKLRNIRYIKPFTVKGQQRIFEVDVSAQDLETQFNPEIPEEVDAYFDTFNKFAEKLIEEKASKKKNKEAS